MSKTNWILPKANANYAYYSNPRIYLQGCKQEIDMTIEQLQEENAKLKQAIIHMYLCKFKSKEGRTFYLVDRSSLNCAYDLAKPKE